MPRPDEEDDRPRGGKKQSGGARQFSQRRDRGNAGARPPRKDGDKRRDDRDGPRPSGKPPRARDGRSSGGQRSGGKPYKARDDRDGRSGGGQRSGGKPYKARDDRDGRSGGGQRSGGKPYKARDDRDGRSGGGQRSGGKPYKARDDRDGRPGGGKPYRGRDDRNEGRPPNPTDDKGRPRRGPGAERKVRLDDDGRPIRSTTLPETDWQPESWTDDGPVRKVAGDAAKRGRKPAKETKKRPKASSAKKAEGALQIDRARLTRELGEGRAKRTIERLGEAADAYGDERFEDSRRLLRALAETLPNEPAVRELYGLTLYRLGRWRSAIKELTAYVEQTGSVDQHPVLADCHRALGHFARVEDLWLELGDISPSAPVMAEGRIVRAGALADQGDLAAAIKLMEEASLGRGGDLKDHHLRLRYVLADLYDRAGERQSALRHFRTLYDNEPEYIDVAERLAALS